MLFIFILYKLIITKSLAKYRQRKNIMSMPKELHITKKNKNNMSLNIHKFLNL